MSTHAPLLHWSRRGIGIALQIDPAGRGVFALPPLSPSQKINSMKTKSIALFSLLLSFASFNVANASYDNRAPDVPSTLQVGAGYKVSFHAYAVGVQMYTATPSAADPTKLVWTFTGPEAVLLDSEGEVVGIHYAYAGPARPGWESQSGSLVVGSRTVPPVTVDPTALPWLVLDAVQAEGPGIFEGTVAIQRVNTTGGLAPSTPPTQLGQQIRVPYTAEYFFYRAQN
jgi:hypothetical protein